MPSGGGGRQTTYQQTQSSNAPPAYIQPYLQQGIQDLTNRYRSGGAPAYYPGPTVASFSPETRQALELQAERALAGSPLTTAAQDQLTKTMRGDYLDPGANPYFADALKASFAPQTEAFLSEVVPGITSQFAGAGRSGGSGLQQAATDRAVTSLARAQSDAAAKAGADMYATERRNQVEGTTAAPALANQDYFDINQLGVVGSAYDDQAQRLIDADIARYNYNANKDWNYINRYLASLNAGYPGGESSGTAYGMVQQPSRDTFSSIFGNAMSGLGAVLPLFGASDVRLKENIQPVGETYDGQNLYLYNYRGDSAPQIGLMAQEVEETNPDAVVMHPEGYLMVDYGKATRMARKAARGLI
jgi:hypothetical protein